MAEASVGRQEEYERLALALPDIPRWLETRSMLLDGDAEVFGASEDKETAYVVRDIATQLISIVGKAPESALAEAVFRNEGRGVAICQMDDQEYVRPLLPDWRSGPATLYVLNDSSRLPALEDGAVRFLALDEILAAPDMPDELRNELKTATLWSEVVAAMAGDRPVSFCYVASETETLWDVSIDTLEPFRRRGYAALAVTAMIQHMHRRKKQPVWGAEETNVASMALSDRLGFTPVDRLVVFTRD